jgi:hypothetical protein
MFTGMEQDKEMKGSNLLLSKWQWGQLIVSPTCK